jgi:predicted Rdx family selenoprotein
VAKELEKPSDWRVGIFDVTIEEGGRGEFTITYKDNIIFDKSKTDRFPENGEITELVKSGEVK